jgi:hypothetical protein
MSTTIRRNKWALVFITLCAPLCLALSCPFFPPPMPPTGSCCAADGTCTVTTQANCPLGGWTAGGTCTPNPCPQPPPTGSCCALDGTCTVTTQANCALPSIWTQGGVCNPNPCLVPPPPVTPVLFIANIAGNNVTSYANPSTVNGNIAPATNLAGAQTQLNGPSDIVVDAGGGLLATNFGMPNSVTGYANATATNGNIAPSRNVQGAATQLAGPTTLAVQTAADLLFVGNITVDAIRVYAGASTAGFNGNLAPTRSILSAALNNPFGINFGASDNLYVANNGGNDVLVFANASNLNGTVMPTRIITSAAFSNLFDVFVDTGDRLYVVNGVGGATPNRINIFNNASTRNGAVMPDITLIVAGAVALTAVAVDNNGVGYIVDNGNNAVYSYNNIATRNGTLPPDRTIQGGNTQLLGPIRVFLRE